MMYVNRDKQNKIVSTYARKQHEGQEFISDEDLAIEQEPERALEAFKSNRQSLINNSIVTIESGLKFNGNEIAMGRMLGKLHRLRNAPVGSQLNWVLADSKTGVKTLILKSDLTEAYDLAADYIDRVWGV